MKFKNEQWRDSGKTGHKTQNEDDKNVTQFKGRATRAR